MMITRRTLSKGNEEKYKGKRGEKKSRIKKLVAQGIEKELAKVIVNND